MKFGFVTCVQLGLSCMEEIYEMGGQLDLVITLNDDQAISKSGRVYLDDFCNEREVSLLKSTHINNEECKAAIKRQEIDWLFIIGWSQIASPELLSAPSKGVLGIHPTLLPQGRGRASIPWAILKNLEKTGVTLFKLDDGVDTGEIVAQETIPLTKESNATSLYDAVNMAHMTLIRKTFGGLDCDDIRLSTQDESLASTWPGRQPSDGEINLNGSVVDAERLVRAVTKPYPGAYIIKGNFKFIVWSAEILEKDQSSSGTGQMFEDGYLLFIDYEEVS